MASKLDEKHKILSLLATIKVCKETRQNFTLLTHSEGLYGCIEHTPMKTAAAVSQGQFVISSDCFHQSPPSLRAKTEKKEERGGLSGGKVASFH